MRCPASQIGLLASVATLRRAAGQGGAPVGPANPLQFRSAVQMGALFQVVMMLVYVVREQFGRAGLMLSGAVVGLTDVDAVTISMARTVLDGAAPATAAQAVAAGILSNTLLKLVLAVAVGRGTFRAATAAGLAAMSLAVAGALVLSW